MTLTVYLAGPYNNCNHKQQTEWRKEIKTKLASFKSLDFEWRDPTEHTTNWTPLKEMVDIEKSDLVIAHLWRESIGTVVGILQGARSGKPIILIDPNYINSRVLNDIVGAGNVVHSIDAAVNRLVNEIAPQLRLEVIVEKRDKSSEPFSQMKLQRSLNSVCSKSKINDALLPVLVSNRVRSRIRAQASSGTIQASKIVEFVFQELGRLVAEPDRLYSDNLEQHADLVRAEWQNQWNLKHDMQVLADYGRQQGEHNEHIRVLLAENRQLSARLRESAVTLNEERFKSVSEAVQVASGRFRFLVFDAKAFESAAASPFLRPDNGYETLDLLDQYAELRGKQNELSAEPTRVMGLKEWLRGQGSAVEYAPLESKSTRSDSTTRSERTILYRGENYVLNKHLKFGKGNANECCRIHFEFLGKEDEYKLLIGHVGRHLNCATSH